MSLYGKELTSIIMNRHRGRQLIIWGAKEKSKNKFKNYIFLAIAPPIFFLEKGLEIFLDDKDIILLSMGKLLMPPKNYEGGHRFFFSLSGMHN